MKRVFAITATALLTLGGTARAQMPADTAARVLETLYGHYLGRAPDPAGYRYWIPRVANGDPVDVLSEMLGSEEYYNRNGANDTGLVQGLYRDVQGRTGLLAQDIGYWVNKLNQYGGDRRAMIAEFLRDARVDPYNPPLPPAPLPGPPVPQRPPAPPVPPLPMPAPQYTPSAPVFPG